MDSYLSVLVYSSFIYYFFRFRRSFKDRMKSFHSFYSKDLTQVFRRSDFLARVKIILLVGQLWYHYHYPYLPILRNDSDTFIQRLIKISKLGYNPRIRFFMLPDQRVLHRKYFGDVLVTKTDHLLHECLPCFKVPLRNPRKILKLSTLFRNSETNCKPILLNTLCKIIHLLTSYLSLGVL